MFLYFAPLAPNLLKKRAYSLRPIIHVSVKEKIKQKPQMKKGDIFPQTEININNQLSCHIPLLLFLGITNNFLYIILLARI